MKAIPNSPALLLSLLLFGLSATMTIAQIPQGFNYQAIAFDNSGEPIRNQTLPVRIAIQSDSLGGTIFWHEVHTGVATNSMGLFTLIVGQGYKISGTASTFADIDWDGTPVFIKTEIDYEGWKTMDASRLWSVPYAMAAGDFTGTLKKLEVAGTATSLDEALFEVKNKNGQTVFAVYNEGVRVNVGNGVNKAVKGGFAIGSFDESKAEPVDLLVVNRDSVRVYIYDDPLNKAVKGGFAIGGFDETKGLTNDYLLVSTDSVRVYLDNNPAKATKGGFAIGSFDETKARDQEYLRISNDSIRMYISNDPSKAVKGGFAIGSFDMTKKGPTVNFTTLTPENYFIGHNAGASNSAGIFNSFIGYEAGKSNTEGSSGVFIGYNAGLMNTTGNSNVFLGNNTGYTNTTGQSNVFIGDSAGIYNSTGNLNVFVGKASGTNNTSGSQNTFIGMNAGLANTTAIRNIFMGTSAGQENTTGGFNVFIGNVAGLNNISGGANIYVGQGSGFSADTSKYNVYVGDLSGAFNKGNQNVFIGRSSGYQNDGNYNTFIGKRAGAASKGSNSVFLGYRAGENEQNSNRLYISNSPAGEHEAMIYGEFDNDLLRINAAVNIRDFMVIKPRSTPPPSPEPGTVYFDSVDNILKAWNGTEWKNLW